MEALWQFSKAIVDGTRYEINGLNIWDFTWQNTGDYINIKDPIYNQPYTFPVYKIVSGDSSAIFATGEFSNCVWGIYEMR